MNSISGGQSDKRSLIVHQALHHQGSCWISVWFTTRDDVLNYGIVVHQITANRILNRVVPCYSCVQSSHKFGSLPRPSSTRDSIHTPGAAVDAVFSMIANTIQKLYLHMAPLYYVCTYLLGIKNKRAVPCVYNLRLNRYIFVYLSYLKIVRVLLDSAMEQLPALGTEARQNIQWRFLQKT